MMKLALFGNGKMGSLIAALAKREGHVIVMQTSKGIPYSIEALKTADVCIDFSTSSAVLSHIKLALAFQKPLVIGTTGWDSDLEEAKRLVESEKGSVVFAPNFSIGISLFSILLAKASDLFAPFSDYNLSGVEMHHKDKKDAPSGTAKHLASLCQDKFSFSSVRGGHFPGTHTIFFDSPEDTITLSHQARNREGFAKGALLAAQWILNKNGWRSFDEVIRSLYTSDYSFSK